MVTEKQQKGALTFCG